MAFVLLLPSFASLLKTPCSWVQALQSIPQSNYDCIVTNLGLAQEER